MKYLLSASDHREELLRFFPPSFAQEVRNLPMSSNGDKSSLFSIDRWSQPIHYSWFSDIMREYPPKVQACFLGVLTHQQAEGLQKLLSLTEKRKNLIPFLRPFLTHILHRTIADPDLLAEQLLPPSPFNNLLKLQRKQLIHLVDFLGLHDLSADLRQVVDKDLLSRIHQALSPDQLHFLQYCSKQPLKWVSPKLGLLAWDGSKKQLNYLLHSRGLIRLAKAIFPEHPSFKWHLMHHFDTGRAKIIQKEFYRKQDSSLLSYFKNQVLHIAKRYQL